MSFNKIPRSDGKLESIKVEYEIASREEARQAARLLMMEANDMLAAITIAGERINCCDEAVIAKKAGVIIGMATIAPQGETMEGPPEIVGTYVLVDHRRGKVGHELLMRAIVRCKERNLTPVHMTAVSPEGLALVQSLSPEMRALVVATDIVGNVIAE